MAKATTFFTIGHSNRTPAEFSDLLHHFGVELVVDVRRFPRSRTNPQFNEDVLTSSLADAGIKYRRLAELGGRRSRTEEVAPETNGYWDNRSFHNYADFALSAEFGSGLEQLRAWGRDHRAAVMCSEAVWWRCHRRIVADHLLAHGDDVLHILGQDRADPARLTPAAVVRPDGSVVYPAPRSPG